MMRKLVLFSSLVFLFFISCDTDSNLSSDRIIKDDAGNVFSIDSVPKRIISLAPNITETIFELKADDLLVGVTDYCDYPPDAKKKEKVGSLLDPNIEKIATLKPDLILMTTEGNSKFTYLSLKSNGYKVFVTNPNDINGICRMIKNIGTVLGKKESGNQLSEKITDSRRYYEVEKLNAKPVSCFMIISLNPLITINKFTYISELMNLAGLENIYGDELIEFPNVNYEDVLLKNPQCIYFLCDTNNTEMKNQTYIEIMSRLSVTEACKKNKVFGIDENVLSRPGPRVTDGIKLLQSKISK
jgi:iron complex transport system substrate-binding protein